MMLGDRSSRELAWIRDRLATPLAIDAEAAVIATNLEGRVAYWNAVAERLCGWRAAEAFQQDILSLTPADYARDQSVEIMTALQAGDVWAGEILLGRRDGSPVRAFVLDIPVGDFSAEQGAIVGVSVPAAQRQMIERRASAIAAAVSERFSVA